jgi:hypothetical protein
LLQARVRGCAVAEFESLVALGLQKLPGETACDIISVTSIAITILVFIVINILVVVIIITLLQGS